MNIIYFLNISNWDRTLHYCLSRVFTCNWNYWIYKR